jgi:hypothetical protein
MNQIMSLDFGKELTGVALIVLCIGIILHIASLKMYGKHDLNDMNIYGIHLVVTAIMTHLFCEITGINKWYCKNGVACRN